MMLKDSLEKIDTATPMMKQYLHVKKSYLDNLLIYQMGDFYEMFYEDAIEASKILNITLTKRGKHEGEDIPMSGFPKHSLGFYLRKLVVSGFKVAICEQLEANNSSKSKKVPIKGSLVRREVVRVVTPGTITEESLLNASESNYLAALDGKGDNFSIAYTDISTGEFFITSFDKSFLLSELQRLSITEILICDKLSLSEQDLFLIKNNINSVSIYPANIFDNRSANLYIKKFYGVNSLYNLEDFSDCELGIIGAIISYLYITHKENLPDLQQPSKLSYSNMMFIDDFTRNSLEINQDLSGGNKYSLFNVINYTETSSGARLLRNYLNAPLVDVEKINERYSIVDFFLKNRDLSLKIKKIMSCSPDLERNLSNIYLKRCSVNNIFSVSRVAKDILTIKSLLHEYRDFAYIKNFIKHDDLTFLDNLAIEIEGAFVEGANDLTNGGFIRLDYDARVDELYSTINSNDYLVEGLKKKYIEKTSAQSLRINHNNLVGYFIEVPSGQASLLHQFPEFHHKQTLANVTRFITDELKDIESNLLSAKERLLQIELEIFKKICDLVISYKSDLYQLASDLSFIDVMISLSELAFEFKYVKPTIDYSRNFSIKAGRHPVVEYFLNNNDNFSPNDCEFDDNNLIHLITGPNMSGKSTFLRQNAIITILAQMGSFIPAESAHIGICDAVFTRIGSADKLAQGQSTFMVEMLETAKILHRATSSSLIVLDEIGRGTSTYDGVSIAWAVTEHIHDHIGARTLFATHYHELIKLESQLSKLSCYTVKIDEHKDEIIFLYEIIKGVAGKSYGIQVAKKSGLPTTVIDRSKVLLEEFSN